MPKKPTTKSEEDAALEAIGLDNSLLLEDDLEQDDDFDLDEDSPFSEAMDQSEEEPLAVPEQPKPQTKPRRKRKPLSLLLLVTLCTFGGLATGGFWLWLEFPKHQDRLLKEQIDVVWAAVPAPGQTETTRPASPSEQKKRAVAKSIEISVSEAGAPERYNDLERDLGKAPLQLVFSRSNVGPLPVIDHYNERSPWQAYGRAYNQKDSRPRIILIVVGLGQNLDVAMDVIDATPPGVTLSILPFSEPAKIIMNAARERGHEVLLSIPMQPEGFPRVDPGPSPLLIDQTDRAFRSRLLGMMGAVPGFAGIIPYYGAPLLEDPHKASLLLDILRRRGVMFVDRVSEDKTFAQQTAETTGLPYVKPDLRLDDLPSTSAVAKKLESIEALAIENGHIVAITRPYPGVIEAIRRWAPTVQTRGISLAPASSLVGQKTRYISPWDDDWSE